MKILSAGHRYVAENFENKNFGQTIQFIEKLPSETNPTELVTINDGTTNEELLAVLIDRMQFLQSKFPCRENSIVITNLEVSLMWLEKRTKDRIARQVEGRQIA